MSAFSSGFDSDEFGKRLREQRIAAGYSSLKAFSSETGIAIQTMSCYETGVRMPDANMLFRIAQAIRCSVDYLLQLEPAPTHELSDIFQQTGLTREAIEAVQLLAGKLSATEQHADLAFVNDLLSSDSLFFINASFYPKWIRAVKRANETENWIMTSINKNKEGALLETRDSELQKHDSSTDDGLTDFDILAGRRYILEHCFSEFLDEKEKQLRTARSHQRVES